MEDFLTKANFAQDDMVTRAFISVNFIRHWGFFRTLSVQELTAMGFPLPIARQLMDGAKSMEMSLLESHP